MDIAQIDPKTIRIQRGLPLQRFYPEANRADAELMEDIRQSGVREPLVVSRGLSGDHTLTHGFRRLSAVWLLIDAGHAVPTVPCRVVEPQDEKGLPL